MREETLFEGARTGFARLESDGGALGVLSSCGAAAAAAAHDHLFDRVVDCIERPPTLGHGGPPRTLDELRAAINLVRGPRSGRHREASLRSEGWSDPVLEEPMP
jgi:hypothetical protein